MPKAQMERGSGNIFEDVGFNENEARALLAKSKLVVAIRLLIEAAGWTQTEASKAIGIPRSRISRMLRGDFNEVSETTLLDCLVRLGCDIKTTIGRCPGPAADKRRQGRFQVIQA